MIQGLYDIFKHWSEKGRVWVYSDTHFEDADCKLMDENWVEPIVQVELIKDKVKPCDTLILLGDVGNPEWLLKLKNKKGKRPYMVLITGNHDKGKTVYAPYFDEIYDGALIISQKVILSHEPIDLPFMLNIHGHDHGGFKNDKFHINVAANVVGYKPICLDDVFKSGALKEIESIHRITIDEAIVRATFKNI